MIPYVSVINIYYQFYINNQEWWKTLLPVSTEHCEASDSSKKIEMAFITI